MPRGDSNSGSLDFAYRAFVSYSHENRPVAAAVTRALKRIGIPWYRSSRHIFRDDEELSPSEPLPDVIQRELGRSAFLVVIASPAAASSSWVNHEVEWWLEEAGRDPGTVIVILAEGDLAHSVPPAAADWVAAQRLAIDLSEVAGQQAFSLRNRKFVGAMARAIRLIDMSGTKRFATNTQIVDTHFGHRRHGFQALFAGILLFCAVASFTAWLGVTASNERAQVRTQTQALNARQRASLAASLSARAAQIRSSDPQTALKLDVAALAIDGTRAIRDSLVTTLAADHFTGQAIADSAGVTAIAEDPSGRRLLTAGGDGVVRLWDIANRTEPAGGAVIYSGLADSTLAVAFGPGNTALVGTGDDVRVVDITNPQKPKLLTQLPPAPGDRSDVAAIVTGPDGKTAITASLGSQIAVWRISGGSSVSLIGRFSSTVNIQAIAVARDMRMLAVGSLLDGSAEIFDLRDLAHPREIATWPAQSKTVDSLAFSPDGQYLATGGTDSELKIWNLRSTIPSAPVYQRTLTGPVRTIAFSPDGKSLAAGTEDGTVRILGLSNIRQPVVQAVLSGHTDAVSAAIFSPDGRTLVTAGEDGRLLTWELDTLLAPSQLSALALPGDRVFAESFSPSASTLAAAGLSGATTAWDVSDPGSPVPRAPIPGTGMVSAMAFSPSGHLLAVGSRQNILIFAVTSAGYQLVEQFHADSSLVTHLAFGGNDQYVFSSGNDNQVRVSALRPHQRPAFTKTFLDGAELLGVSNTDVLAAATGSYELSLWDVKDPADPRRLSTTRTPHTAIIETGSFRDDGRLLATAGRDRRTVLWDVSDPRDPRFLPALLTEQNGDIDAVAFSPDGHLLATGSYDKTTVLWDVTLPSQPSPVAVLTGQSDWIEAVAFDRHDHLATASYDGTIMLWDTARLDKAVTSPVSQACAITRTGLSRPRWAYYTNGYPYARQGGCPG